jgi:hypothetical protein
MNYKSVRGFIKSLLIYYGKPFGAFRLEKWTNKAGILNTINQYSQNIFSGDIYARLVQ